MTDEKDAEIAALKAQLERAGGGNHTQRSGHSKLSTVVAVVVALAFLGWCSQQGQEQTEYSASPNPTWTPPDGFVTHRMGRGGSVGVEWDMPTRSECRGSGTTCFAMNVVTERDCPRNLYVSITLFNEADDNIGWTNDTAQGVQAGERVRLVFDTYERGAESARIAEINCY